MKKLAQLLGYITLLAFPLACSDGNSDTNNDDASSNLEEGPGEFLDDFATSDKFFTQMTKPAEGLASSPHGVVQIYYSSNLLEAVGKGRFNVPAGTVAIKAQSFDSEGDYGELLVMIKQEPGTLPDSDDWLYEVRNQEGQVETSGGSAVEFCNDCHSPFKDTGGLPGFFLMN